MLTNALISLRVIVGKLNQQSLLLLKLGFKLSPFLHFPSPYCLSIVSASLADLHYKVYSFHQDQTIGNGPL